MRVGVYGGSFDPIHHGHLAPVEEARVKAGLDEIVYVPAAAPPHKPDGPTASGYHRFAMAALALAPFERFRLSDIELSPGASAFTIDTLARFREALPGAEVLLVLGSDSLVQLPTWRSWREIAGTTRIVAVLREPYGYAATRAALPETLAGRLAPEEAALDGAPPGATIIWGGNVPVTISSTWIRRAIQEGDDPSESLPEAVHTYVRRQGLYRASLPRRPLPSRPSTT